MLRFSSAALNAAWSAMRSFSLAWRWMERVRNCARYSPWPLTTPEVEVKSATATTEDLLLLSFFANCSPTLSKLESCADAGAARNTSTAYSETRREETRKEASTDRKYHKRW